MSLLSELPVYWQIAIAVASAAVISLISTPLVKRLAKRIGAIDNPEDSRRIHTSPIPRLGGLAIFIGFLLCVILFADLDRQIRGIITGAVIIVIIGVIDDIFQLRAIIKLIVQIFAAVIAVYHGVVVEAFVNPFILSEATLVELGYFAIPITIIWIVAITNSVNFIDGLDGLAVGVSAVSSVVMLIIALVFVEINVAIVLAALVGACIGFLPHNFNPAKIFMGDTGALLLGYVLATVSILGLFKLYAVVSLVVPLLALGIPLFDTSFAFFRRMLRGQNPMNADRGHLHHRLLNMGLSQKQAVILMYAISALLGFIAVVMVISTRSEVRALILTAAVLVVGTIVYIAFKGRKKKPNDESEERNEEH